MKSNVLTAGLILLALSFVRPPVAAQCQIKLSGDVTATTTYMWRGIKQFHGAALQGTTVLAGSFFASGMFYSSMNSADFDVETDLFLEFLWPGGAVSGVTIYCYNFKRFNSTAVVECEAYIKLTSDLVDLAFYYVPEQKSLDEYRTLPGYAISSLYWAEGSCGFTAANLDWRAGLGYGTYSSRFAQIVKDDPVGIVQLSASKPLGENISITWDYSVSMDKDIEDGFWAVLSMVF